MHNEPAYSKLIYDTLFCVFNSNIINMETSSLQSKRYAANSVYRP